MWFESTAGDHVFLSPACRRRDGLVAAWPPLAETTGQVTSFEVANSFSGTARVGKFESSAGGHRPVFRNSLREVRVWRRPHEQGGVYSSR